MRLIKLIKSFLWAMAAFVYPVDCDGAVQINCNFEQLLNAIEQVESGGNPFAAGDIDEETGEYQAVGAYQIHKIYVDDVNRILGHQAFSYDDRWDKGKSRQMVSVYLRHYGGNKGIEAMARIHVGGPKGYKKESTLPYWEKIKLELARCGCFGSLSYGQRKKLQFAGMIDDS